MPAPAEPPGYPARWEADVVLSDGATMHVRPIVPEDGPAIQALHRRLSAETIYFRFFTPLNTLPPRLLDRLVRVDYVDRFALVGLLGDDIIGVARTERLPSADPDEAVAEVAFLVDDQHQGRGIGTVLLEHLATIAADAGITRFVADTLPDNRRMLRVFHEAGFDDERVFADGVVRVGFPIEPTEASRRLVHERERRAAARSVRRLLAPKTVAVIGASTRPTLGQLLVRTILDGDPRGPVYPVNPHAHHVCGVRAYPTVLDIPDSVDLAVIVVPAAAVPEVVEQCARKRVGGLVVISGGFAELDEEGAELEHRVVSEARRNGMRVIGPNSMGVVNTDPEVRLNATFSPTPPEGRIGFVAQSGALGVVLLDELARRGLGVSTFVSAGNKADVSGNDLLQYWDEDPATDVVLMYIESFGNPRTFARVARRVARRKPIVAVKSARSPAGSRAAGAHRAAQGDDVVDALFQQSGVIRTRTLEELFDVAQLLGSQPLPAGPRVAIVANVGGPAVLAADACHAAGLEMATFGTATEERVRALLRADDRRAGDASGTNPVGLPTEAQPRHFAEAVAAVAADEGVDAVLALYTAPMAAPIEAMTDALSQASVADKPLLLCALGHRELLDPGEGRRPIPAFAFPEAAAQALGQVQRYAAWRRRPEGAPPQLSGVDRDAVRTRVTEWLGTGNGPAEGAERRLTAEEAAAVLADYGVPASPGRMASWTEETTLVLVVSQDPLFGTLVSLGTVGRHDEAPHPRSGRATPLSEDDVTELVDNGLGPFRPDGEPWGVVERAAVHDVVARVARLAEDVPELVELTVNPLIVDDEGALATAPSARLRPWRPHPELALRRLG